MSISDRLITAQKNIGAYSITPICLFFFILSFVIPACNLHISSLSDTMIHYIGTVFGFFACFTWFRTLNQTSRLKRFVTEACIPLFFTSTLLLIGSYLHLLQQGQQLSHSIQAIVFFLFSFSGFIAFYENRQRITQTLEQKQSIEISRQHDRSIHFSEKYSSISRIPVIKQIFKWAYSEGLLYSIGLLLLIIIGLFLRLQDVSNLFFWVDESTTMLVSERIADGKGLTLLSGKFYPRGLIYHHYIALLIKSFGSNLYLIGRVANIPFYIITITAIYYFGKRISNKATGLVASALFCFSWISISIFREARFYEAWLSAYVLFAILLYHLIEKYTQDKTLTLINFIKNSIPQILLLLLVAIICYDCQELTAFILYPLTAFGLLIFFLKGEIKGVVIAIYAFLLLVLGLFTQYKFQVFSRLIKQTDPAWKTLYPDTPILGLWNSLLSNDYRYLVFFVILSAIILIVFKKELKVLFLSAFIFAWYFIIAVQGYEVNMIRYYYPIFPFLVIQIAYCFTLSIALLKNDLFKKYTVYFLLTLLIGYSVFSSVIESNSIATNTSKNVLKNDNFGKEIQFINSTIDINNSTIVTNNIWAGPYTAYYKKTPNYIAFDTLTVPFDLDKIDPMTNVKELDFSELPQLPKPVYVIFNYPTRRISPETFTQINSMSDEIYRNKNIRIFQIK